MLLNPWLVVPGERLGGVQIGAESKSLDRLGKPTGGDGAMGHFWASWVGKGGGRLDVYTTRKFPKGTSRDIVTVDVVRATSPRFHLASGIHPGNSIASMKTAYPSAKRAGTYTSREGKSEFWDVVRQGLAWETRGGRVFALIVHRKGIPMDPSVGPYVHDPIPNL